MSKLNIKPLADRVLIEPAAAETKTSSGIIIPDSAKEKPLRGEIIATGNGKVLEDGKVLPLEVKAGDTVLFSKYAGTEIKIEADEYLMMREDDILGVFTN